MQVYERFCRSEITHAEMRTEQNALIRGVQRPRAEREHPLPELPAEATLSAQPAGTPTDAFAVGTGAPGEADELGREPIRRMSAPSGDRWVLSGLRASRR